MNQKIDCITGSESASNDEHPLTSLIEFYKGFNQQDLKIMQRNWSTEHAIIMNNPIGGLRKGREEILRGYEKIFFGPAKVYVEFYDYTLMQTEQMFCVAGRERGTFSQGDEEIKLEIRTSRVYQITRQGWRQVHHHGSIDNATLLQRYQDAILKLPE